jgi:hypothetical protein
MGAGGGSVAGSAATMGAVVESSSALGPRMRLTMNTTSPTKPRITTSPVHRGLSDAFTADGRVRRAVVSSAMEPRLGRCGEASAALGTGRGDGRGFEGGDSSAGPCSTTLRFSGA